MKKETYKWTKILLLHQAECSLLLVLLMMEIALLQLKMNAWSRILEHSQVHNHIYAAQKLYTEHNAEELQCKAT